MERTIELGPIRPPSEATSILLRLTRNCPWNKCTFCPVYKGEKFSRRSLEDIKADIDTISLISDAIREEEGRSGNSPIFKDFSIEGTSDEDIRKVMYWQKQGMKSLFLQDADSLVMKTDQLVEILKYIKEKFPSLERITTYGRAKTISRKSEEDLKSLRSAGLTRIHIGMESGSDKVLKLLEKGVTAEEQIDAGKKAVAAGFELSEYFMPGSGGVEYSYENAVDSAHVLSSINPTYIRLRSTIPVPGTPLYSMMKENKWKPVSDTGIVKEIRIFIENLNCNGTIIKSDHIMNLLEDVEGELPRDRESILHSIDSFLNMSEADKESFIIGRRTGRVRLLSDYKKDPDIERIKTEIKKRYSSVDAAMMEILTGYI